VVRAQATGTDPGRLIYEVNRRLITAMIEDVAQAARARIAHMDAASSDAIAMASAPIVDFSASFKAELLALKAHLMERVYRHEKVMSVMRTAETLVAQLFQHFMQSETGLPDHWVKATAGVQGAARAELIGDFVAGMTDRYAIVVHGELFDHTPELR
jgi:dGTPase